MGKYKESFYNIKICTDDKKRVLLFNSYTSALCWVDEDIYRSISGKIHIEEKDILPNMVKLGFVVKEKEDEVIKYIIERNNYLFEKKPSVMGCVISPTMKCNMSCIYCFQNDMKLKDSLNVKDLDAIIEFIRHSIENNDNLQRFWIKWFGGEPGLEIEIIKYISKKVKEICEVRNVTFDALIVSNGLVLTPNVIDDLVSRCNINTAQITVDGTPEIYSLMKGVSEECFDKVIDNISYMSNYMRVNININISKQNTKEVYELIEYFSKQKNINKKNIRIYLSMIYKYTDRINADQLFNEDEYQLFLTNLFKYIEEKNLLKLFEFKLPCRRYSYCSSMQVNTLCIGPKGNLYRCETNIGHEEYKIGTCTDGRFYNEIDWEYVSNPLRDKCKKCKILPICAGGCRDRNLYTDIDQSCDAKKQEIITMIIMYMKNR